VSLLTCGAEMSVTLLFPEDAVVFGQHIAPEINDCLQRAVKSYERTEEAENWLWAAQQLNPEQLEVYIALYKFYFYKYRLEDAERVARMALEKCAQLGGFSADWTVLTFSSANWMKLFGAERVYLYTLKALAFIRLRRLDFAEGQRILEKLQELDPQDLVGSSVLSAVAAGLTLR